MPVIKKRYTPPTCTLEITAQTLALSRWMRQPAVQSLGFSLSFDGVASRNQPPIAIRGDRKQLEALSLTVNDYIEQLLAQGHADLPVVSSDPSTRGYPPTPESKPLLTAPNGSGEEGATEDDLQLRSRTLMSHELVLGSLATDTSGANIPLTVSQLFDLASALDDCAEEMAMLPELAEQPERAQPWLRSTPVWARSAAVVVLLVGVTTATWNLTQSNRLRNGDQSTITSLNQQQSTTESGSAPQLSPRPLRKSPLQSGRPSPSQSSPTQSPAPSPSISASESRPKPPQGLTDIAPTAPSDSERFPVTPSAPTSPRFPVTPSAPTSPARSQRSRPTSRPSIAAQRPNQSKSPGNSLSQNRPSAKPAEPPAVPQPAPPKKDSPAAVMNETASQPSLDGFADRFGETEETQVQPDDRQQLGRRSNSQPTAVIAPQKSKLEASPQVTEVQQYVAQRWQAPPTLSQNLEYLLVLNPNGTLQQVKPLGAAATQYLKQVPLPGINQPFVSPLRQPSNAQIRLILLPDGTVQTRLNTPN